MINALVALSVSAWLGQVPPKSIAAPSWRTVQVSRELADFYSDTVASALRKHGYRVVTATEIQSLLSDERQKALLGCGEESSSCIAELASALGCDATLLVNLARLEDTYRGNLKVVSSLNGNVLAEAQVEASGEKALVARLEAAAGRLAEGLKPGSVPVVGVSASRGARRFWWAPALAGGALVAAGAGCFAVSEAAYARLERDVTARVRITEADIRPGATFQTLGWVGVGVGAAALVGAGALLLFGGDAAVAPAVAVTPTGAAFGLSGEWP